MVRLRIQALSTAGGIPLQLYLQLLLPSIVCQAQAKRAELQAAQGSRKNGYPHGFGKENVSWSATSGIDDAKGVFQGLNGPTTHRAFVARLRNCQIVSFVFLPILLKLPTRWPVDLSRRAEK